ncbi:MAG: acyl-CoA thioesterase [Phototrophicales bacterium]
MEPKRIDDSRVTLSVVMGPQDTNSLGNVHGGVIMRLIDEAAGFAAMRHAGRPAVTVVVDSITFMHPIHVGMLVMFNAELTYVGRTSMEVRVEVIAENVLQGKSRLSNTAYLVFVALDDNGRPTQVPPLIFETEEEIRRAKQAEERQVYRKQQRAKEV